MHAGQGSVIVEEGQPIASFERPFSLWEYVVSLSQLLVRSPKQRSDGANVDIVFVGVAVMQVRSHYERLVLRHAIAAERVTITRVRGHTPRPFRHQTSDVALRAGPQVRRHLAFPEDVQLVHGARQGDVEQATIEGRGAVRARVGIEDD